MDSRPFAVYGKACGDDVIFEEEVTEDPREAAYLLEDTSPKTGTRTA